MSARRSLACAAALVVTLVLSLSHVSLVHGQAFVPSVAPMRQCSSGTYITFGDSNVTHLTYHYQGMTAYSGYIHGTPFNVTTSGVVVSQVSLGLLDNTPLYQAAHIRLAIFSVSDTILTPVAQTEEITLYPSGEEVIDANLMAPTELPVGHYMIGFVSDTSLYTGANDIVYDGPPTSAYYYYQGYDYYLNFQTFSAYNYYGSRALQVHGCLSSTANPLTLPNTALYRFCAVLQTPVTPQQLQGPYSYQYTESINTFTLSGVLVVSTNVTGTNAQGNWGQVQWGAAEVTIANSGGYYYPSTGPASEMPVSAGYGRWITTINQQLYTDNPTSSSQVRVDGSGLGFVALNGTQVVISYNATTGKYQLYNSAAGVGLVASPTLSSFQITPVTYTPDFSLLTSCAAPVPTGTGSGYVPDVLSCPAGSVPVHFADSLTNDTQSMYNTEETEYSYANTYYFRQFTCNTPNTVLQQLTWLINANWGRTIKARLGLFYANSSVDQSPTYQLLGQTRELVLSNVNDTVIRANLLTPVPLTLGWNYSIGILTDQWVYAPYGYFINNPQATLVAPYSQSVGQAGTLPSLVPTTGTSSQTLALGAHACALQQTTVQYSYCAVFVYDYMVNVYSGVVTALANANTASNGAQYRVLVDNYGTANMSTDWSSSIYPITFHSFNLWTNNYVYELSTNNATSLDVYGMQFVVDIPQSTGTAMAVQIASYYDTVSASIRYRETQQYYYTTYQSSPGIALVSSFQYQPYSGGAIPQCVAPSRPANIVSPRSVARSTCPALGNFIQSTFGNSDVGDYSQHAEGTHIAANTIYTHAFTAVATSTVTQLAVGLLSNTEATTEIHLQLGIYAANGTLLSQPSGISLTAAVDQLLIQDLPFVVNLVAGQRYFIALVSDDELDVAVTNTGGSPTMAYSAYATSPSNGLPALFTASGTGESISVAAYGCTTSTHSFCGYTQYYQDSQQPVTVTYLYQGLLQAGSETGTNSFGRYQSINALSGHMTVASRSSYGYMSNSYASITLASTPSQPNFYDANTQSQVIDTTGWELGLTSNYNYDLNGRSLMLSYDAEQRRLTDTFRDGFSRNVNSGMSVIPMTSDGSLPNCNVATSLPAAQTPANPAELQCPSGESFVRYGDENIVDLGPAAGIDGQQTLESNYLWLRRFTSSLTKASLVYQLAVGVNANRNTYNRLRLALYNSNFTLMSTTGDITMINPADTVISGALLIPQYLAPNALYYIAVWTENTIFSGEDYDDGTVAVPYAYVPQSYGSYATLSWPKYFPLQSYYTTNQLRPLGAFACTTATIQPAPSSSSSSSAAMPPSSSSSTGGGQGAVSSSSSRVSIQSSSSSASAGNTPASSSSSTGVFEAASSSHLSDSAIAGVVVGCVIGSNLVVLCCVWLCCFGPSVYQKMEKSNKDPQWSTRPVELEESRTADESSRAEMEMGDVSRD